MVVSQIRGPQCRASNTLILTIGTPKMVPLILGDPHITLRMKRKLIYGKG